MQGVISILTILFHWPMYLSLCLYHITLIGLPRWLSDKESICQCRKRRRCRKCGFNPWVVKIPWRRKWQPNPVFLPGKSHGQRSLACASPWGCKELETTSGPNNKNTALITVTLQDHFEIRKFESSNCVLKDCFGYSASLESSYELQNFFLFSQKKMPLEFL